MISQCVTILSEEEIREKIKAQEENTARYTADALVVEEKIIDIDEII